MSQTDPVDFVIKSDFKEKVKAAVIVLGDWVTTMTPTGSKERKDLLIAILKLNKIEREKKQSRPKRDKIGRKRRQARRKLRKTEYRKIRSQTKSRKTEHKEKPTHALYYVAREFGAIDKSQMSIEDQCAVLSSCLQNPLGDRDAHLANVASQKAARNPEQDGKEDIDQDVVNENENKSKDDGDRKDDLDNSSKPDSSSDLRPPDGLQTLLLTLSSENPKTILESLDDNEDSDVEINDDIDGDGGVVEEFPKQQRPADEDDDWAPLLEMDVALAAAAKAKESEDNDAIDDNPDSANESDNTDDVKEDI